MILSHFSRVFADRDSLLSGALELASEIASKSPIAVQGSKVNLIHARDHSVADGLQYVVCIILVSFLRLKKQGSHSYMGDKNQRKTWNVIKICQKS